MDIIDNGLHYRPNKIVNGIRLVMEMECVLMSRWGMEEKVKIINSRFRNGKYSVQLTAPFEFSVFYRKYCELRWLNYEPQLVINQPYTTEFHLIVLIRNTNQIRSSMSYNSQNLNKLSLPCQAIQISDY